MPKGPQGQRRPTDVIGAAVRVMRIATGEEAEDARSPASAAAAARWSPDSEDDEIPKVICGSSDRPMRIQSLGIEVPCYVIEGERRVFVQRGMVDALGMSRGSAGGGGDRLANFITGDRIKPFVAKELSEVIISPIKFRAPNGSIAYGYDAEALHQVCLSILAARREGKLQKQQEHIGERCELLIAAWSLAGIVSAAEARTFSAIMHRALVAYAAQSMEYQGVQSCVASSPTPAASRPSNTAS